MYRGSPPYGKLLEVNKHQLEDLIVQEVYQVYCNQFQVSIDPQYKKSVGEVCLVLEDANGGQQTSSSGGQETSSSGGHLFKESSKLFQVSCLTMFAVHLVLHPHGIAPTLLKFYSGSPGAGFIFYYIHQGNKLYKERKIVRKS